MTDRKSKAGPGNKARRGHRAERADTQDRLQEAKKDPPGHARPAPGLVRRLRCELHGRADHPQALAELASVAAAEQAEQAAWFAARRRGQPRRVVLRFGAWFRRAGFFHVS